MWHFILVFTVCQNTPLGVSCIQRVNPSALCVFLKRKITKNAKNSCPRKSLKEAKNLLILTAIHQTALKIIFYDPGLPQSGEN